MIFIFACCVKNTESHNNITVHTDLDEKEAELELSTAVRGLMGKKKYINVPTG